jgi:hypothetical protein
MAAIAFENITSGMGTAAFVALLMSLCNRQVHGHPLRLAVGLGGGRAHLRQPAVRRAVGIGRLAGLLPVLGGRGRAGALHGLEHAPGHESRQT